MNETTANFDQVEIEKFTVIAEQWWNRKGPFRGLHDMNPLRVEYILNRAGIKGKKVLDIGCGGGILCEALGELGGIITGIDINEPALAVANTHAQESGLSIDYRNISAENFALTHERSFDIVTCMELLEHVPAPYSVIEAAQKMVKPGGHVFFSTINRTFRSYLLAVVISEYVLKLLKRNTHNPQKFIKPEQLKSWGEKTGLKFMDLSGIFYFPYIPVCRLSRSTGVNYLMYFVMEN